MVPVLPPELAGAALATLVFVFGSLTALLNLLLTVRM